MRNKRYLFLFALLLLFASFRFYNRLVFEVPDNWPQPVYDFKKNPLSAQKIELGRRLFYEPLLSRDNSISCATCHSPYSAFAHTDHALSHGIDNKIGKRNAPALINLAWQSSFMWDGAIHHLDFQALTPISNPLEMDENISNVLFKLNHSAQYKKLFLKAFGDTVISGERTLKSIAQFLLTLKTANSKYDSMMCKKAVFTEQEKRGYALFKTNCAKCHTEPLFTNNQFETNGISMDTNLLDFGRMKTTQNSEDSIFFKVPTLRNVEYTYPYMHDGRFKRLSEVMIHYSETAVASKRNGANSIAPMHFTSDERVDLIAFLLTLSDPSFNRNSYFIDPHFKSAKFLTRK